MPKCKRCGKGGLFFKTNSEGLCDNCAHIISLEQENDNLKGKFNALNSIYKSLKSFMEETGANDAFSAKKAADEYKRKQDELKNKCNTMLEEIKKLQKTINDKQNEILVLDETITLESFSLYKPKFKFLTSDE
jgi:chromosome segregation ATPase